tara:strand:+ start:360 stop:539 length:180 start_codon:yes stop_codon:yes gene_type:complete
MTIFNVMGSLRKINAVAIAINGTEKIKTLALIGPRYEVAYIYTVVPNDIAPIETKKKFK